MNAQLQAAVSDRNTLQSAVESRSSSEDSRAEEEEVIVDDLRPKESAREAASTKTLNCLGRFNKQ